MYIDERHFVKTAIQSMNELEQCWTDEGIPFLADRTEQTRQNLTAIKETASSVQARGVFRSAILCEDVLSRLVSESPTKFHSSLSELKRLITLYADGLFEIDPEFADTFNQPEGITPEKTTINVSNSLDQHAISAQTLKGLMPLVRDNRLRQSLNALMQPTSGVPANLQDRKTMSLDALIQPISNLVLSEARHNGKTVTVSYAADFVDIPFEAGEMLQDVLESACLHIVANGITPLTSPQTLSSNTTPQISMTGQLKNGFVLFSISWIGREINKHTSEQSKFSDDMSELEQAGGSHSFDKPAVSENSKSRHTLYIKIPMPDPRMVPHRVGAVDTSNYLEMNAG